MKSERKINGINYKTNSSYTEYTMTAWYFGKGQVDAWTKEAKKAYRKTGETTFRFWQDGTGFMTIEIY